MAMPLLSTLDWVTQWPLWVCKKTIGKDGQVWIILDDIPPIWEKPDGLRRALEEFHRLEYTCREEGLVGWLASVDFSNWYLIRAVQMLGATEYAHDEESVHYYKKAYDPPLPRRVRDALIAGKANRETYHVGTA